MDRLFTSHFDMFETLLDNFSKWLKRPYLVNILSKPGFYLLGVLNEMRIDFSFWGADPNSTEMVHKQYVK